MSKQHHTRFLPETHNEEARRRENTLRYAFLNTTSANGHRPAGTNGRRLTNAARRSNATTPWEQFAEPLRAVVLEAASRNSAVQQRTEELVMDTILALAHYILEPLEGRLMGEVDYLAICKEVPEAVQAITADKLNPTPENAAKADRETAEAARAFQLYRGGLRTAQRAPKPFARSMGATPPLSMA